MSNALEQAATRRTFVKSAVFAGAAQQPGPRRASGKVRIGVVGGGFGEDVATEVRTHFGSKVCRTVVPRTVRLSEAPSFGQPIITFDPSSRGAVAYREVAKEVSRGTARRAG